MNVKREKPFKRVRFDIDEQDNITGVKTISLVDEPAIESDFIVYSAQIKKRNRMQLRLVDSIINELESMAGYPNHKRP